MKQRKMIAVVDKEDGKILELHDGYVGVSGLAVFPNMKTAVKWFKERVFSQLNSPVEWLMREARWREHWKEQLAGVEFIELKSKGQLA